MHRRFTAPIAALITVSAAIALAGCASPASPAASESEVPLTPITLGLNYVATVEHYAPYYAMEEGLFADAGLDVEIIPVGDTPPMTLLAAGEVDVAVTDTSSMIQAAAKGEEFVAIAAQYQTAATSMTCREDSGVEEITDLKGKRIATKSAASTWLPIVYSSAGITEADVTLVPIGNQDLSVIIAGQADCMFTTNAFNEPRSIANAGVPVVVLPLAEFGVPNQGNVLATTRENLDDPDMRASIVALVGALADAWSVFVDDPEAGAEYMIDKAFVDGLDPDQQKFQAERQTTLIATDATAERGLMALDPESWEVVAEKLQQAGITPEVIDVEPLIDDLTVEADTPKK
jgi:NitT/TauT family transport system substrate-binding protein